MPDHFKVEITTVAKFDLLAIVEYITQNDALSKALNFLDELENKITSLSQMPYRCRKSFYHDDENIRDLIYKGYTIVFEVSGDTVFVLSVFRQQ